MDWNDWPIVCWTLLTLLCLWGRRWIDAFSAACFAVCMMLDSLMPSAPWQLKWAFGIIGATVVVSQVLKEYRKYKDSLGAG